MKNAKLTHMDRNELIQRTFPYLLKRLEDAGIDATPQVDPKTNGYILTVDTMHFNVENLLSDLSRIDPVKHQEQIERWVAFMIETLRMPEYSLNDPDELRRRIRTRIIRSGQSSDLPITYIRPFTDGLAKALYLDFPNSVSLVTDQSLARYPLSVDELFYYGQINTDNEPIDTKQQVGPFTELLGESPFIAGKAANIGALVNNLQIDAPHGLFFAIPQRSVLLYAPIDPEDISRQILQMADYMRFAVMEEFGNNNGFAISRDIFYCLPTGEFGPITRGDNPDLHELFSNPKIDFETFMGLVEKYLYVPESFVQRFLAK